MNSLRRTSGLVWVFGLSAFCAAVVAINYGSGDGVIEHLIVYLQVFVVCAFIGSTIWASFHVVFWLIRLPAQVRRLHLKRQVQRRRRLGLCPRCGYDLRAAINRCPECGALIDDFRPRPAIS